MSLANEDRTFDDCFFLKLLLFFCNLFALFFLYFECLNINLYRTLLSDNVMYKNGNSYIYINNNILI